MKDSGPDKQKPHRRVATMGRGSLRGPASFVPQAQERKQQAKRGWGRRGGQWEPRARKGGS